MRTPLQGQIIQGRLLGKALLPFDPVSVAPPPRSFSLMPML